MLSIKRYFASEFTITLLDILGSAVALNDIVKGLLTRDMVFQLPKILNKSYYCRLKTRFEYSH